jgi:uncharacterized protein YbjT (DUF2867 family)
MKTALLAGATGLIGSQLLQLLLQDNYYSKVRVLVRKPIDVHHPKLDVIVVDFDNLSSYQDVLTVDDVFCCLGTTMKQAGSKDAFRKVDLDYPHELARITKKNGARQYLLVSALGANKNASIFYNKVKGETEQAIINVEFQTLHIFRPSLLTGDRKQIRTGEDAAKTFYKIFAWLIPKKYKAIEAATVARGMVYYAKAKQTGTHTHESGPLQQFR